MDIRAHSIALISVIVGLGLADLLGNLNRLIRARVPVAWDLLPLAWALLALLFVTNYWWSVYTGAVVAAAAGNSAGFLAGLLLPILLYLICAAALPTGRDDSQRLDMRAAYLAESRYFFTVVAIYAFASLAQALIVTRFQIIAPILLQRGLLLVAVLPLLWRRSIGYHYLATAVCLLALVYRLLDQVLR
jgi:hypothetical protein